jgi:hypothetical protein
VLELRHMLLGRGFFRKRPGQHEFGLEHRPAAGDNAVEGRTHPPEHWMAPPMLDAFDRLPGVALEPMPIKNFSHESELDDEVAGQVLGLGFALFFPPQAEQGGFIVAHDDPGVGAADEAPSSHWSGMLTQFHDPLFYVLYVVLCINNNIP